MGDRWSCNGWRYSYWLGEVWRLCDNYEISRTALSLSFFQISTVIPGIKTPTQAIINSTDIQKLVREDTQYLIELYKNKFQFLLEYIELEES